MVETERVVGYATKPLPQTGKDYIEHFVAIQKEFKNKEANWPSIQYHRKQMAIEWATDPKAVRRARIAIQLAGLKGL